MVRDLHPADHYTRRIRKFYRMFERELDFKGIKFSVKISDIHKIEKQNCMGISPFGYENKVKYVKKFFRKTYWFIIDKKIRRKILFSFQRF